MTYWRKLLVAVIRFLRTSLLGISVNTPARRRIVARRDSVLSRPCSCLTNPPYAGDSRNRRLAEVTVSKEEVFAAVLEQIERLRCIYIQRANQS